MIVSIPDLCTLTYFDLCMEEGTCHEMVIDILKSFSCMSCLYLHFFISFKNDFQVDVERMINRKREMSRNICVDGLKNIVRRDNSSVGTSLYL